MFQFYNLGPLVWYFCKSYDRWSYYDHLQKGEPRSLTIMIADLEKNWAMKLCLQHPENGLEICKKISESLKYS